MTNARKSFTRKNRNEKKKAPESFPVSSDGLVFYRQPKKLQNILYSKNREHGQMKHYLPH